MNPIFGGAAAAYALGTAVACALGWLNLRHARRHGLERHRSIEGRITPETLLRMRDYTLASGRLSLARRVFTDLFALAVVACGVLGTIDHALGAGGPIIRGVAFVVACAALISAAHVPFDLANTFGVERAFGFSTTTTARWARDLCIRATVSGAVLVVSSAILLALVSAMPGAWWVPAWALFVCLQTVLVWAYPRYVAPLFNRFEPAGSTDLKESVAGLLAKAGFTLDGLFVMVASSRSTHTNAYLTGFGRTRRIVLFDTLVAGHPRREILAVLAHELGHLRLGHIAKNLGLSAVFSVAAFFALSKIITCNPLYEAFRIETLGPQGGLVIAAVLSRPLDLLLSPARAWLSRLQERQADAYAHGLMGESGPLVDALLGLARHNLVNLHPHPLYAWFFLTHPRVIERIEDLERMDARQVAHGAGPA